MSRKIIVAGNWKMNHGPTESRKFFESLPPDFLEYASQSNIEKIIFAPALSLAACLESAEKNKIRVGAQNAHFEKNGAFTGEISGPMLNEIGVRDVLVGHSERRQFFGETNETVRKRTESLLEQGLRVMVCVGETLDQREAEKTEAVLAEQLSTVFVDKVAAALDGVRLSIAYEPVWAIGTGKTATPEQAEEAHCFIRAWLAENCSPEAAEKTPLLYGGSAKPANFSELLSCKNVDGGLIGGASLKPTDFAQLVRIAAEK